MLHFIDFLVKKRKKLLFINSVNIVGKHGAVSKPQVYLWTKNSSSLLRYTYVQHARAK